MVVDIVVNGEPRTASEADTILDLLRELGLDPERVAVELDRRLIKKAQWASSVLHEGAQIEIVQFVGGG